MAGTAEEQRRELKDLALSIARAQTNVYVKELLREHGVRIGSTKEDFDRNLIAAIDDGVLTLEHFETWLNEVEGWGQQHVYAYRLTPQHKQAFKTAELAEHAVRKARLAKYWRAPTAQTKHLDFPDDENLHLVSITYDDSLRFHWHKGTKYWKRTKEEEQHDKPPEMIEGFEYQFRAYRGYSMREVMRFEIRPRDGLAALFIPKPIGSKDHTEAYEQATATIRKILDVSALESRRMLIGNIIKKLDQQLTFDDAAAADVSPQSTRLRSGAAYVEFAALSREGSYFDSDEVKDLRATLRTDRDIDPFEGTAGTFRFSGGLGRVELFAGDNRIRLWSSLTASDVWHILRLLAKYQ